MTDDASFPWSQATAAARLEQSLARLESDEPAVRAVYTKLFEAGAQKDLAELGNRAETPLRGALVSIKALLDVKGEVTTAASKVLQDAPPAAEDAPAVARLRAAGAILTGHTNMTQFAYSGLGLNPYHGTPDNPARPGHIPGGSTSGGAVSVALGLADIAIGSDTGGSLRIPAAFTGLTGFKPTQASVPLEGCLALSDSLDSLGPIARSVAACELAWQIMAGRSPSPSVPRPGRLVVARNFGFDGLEPAVERGFEALLSHVSAAGLEIVERPLAALESYGEIPVWQFSAVESRAHYDVQFRNDKDSFDPRVHVRMARADEISAVDYRRTLNKRARLIAAVKRELDGDFLLLPTTPILAPDFKTLEDDEAFTRLNLLALRNPSLANVADGCSLALPYRHDGTVLSAMLIGTGGRDGELLAAGRDLERRLPGI